MPNSTILSTPIHFCSHCGERLHAKANFCSHCATPTNRDQLEDFTAPPSSTRTIGVSLLIGIVLMPYIFSWFTLRKGHSALARIVSFTWLTMFVLSNVLAFSLNPRQTSTLSSNAIASKERPQADASAAPRKQAEITTPPAEAWATQESRDILGAFFIKPYLRQWLKDPDSLQDFQVVDATADKKLKGAYRVTVSYRARNSFGALVPERRTVTMIYNPKDDNHPWVVMP
jgi:hypothetical protein